MKPFILFVISFFAISFNNSVFGFGEQKIQAVHFPQTIQGQFKIMKRSGLSFLCNEVEVGGVITASDYLTLDFPKKNLDLLRFTSRSDAAGYWAIVKYNKGNVQEVHERNFDPYRSSDLPTIICPSGDSCLAKVSIDEFQLKIQTWNPSAKNNQKIITFSAYRNSNKIIVKKEVLAVSYDGTSVNKGTCTYSRSLGN